MILMQIFLKVLCLLKIIQEKLQLTPNTEFILSFDAYSPSNNEIEIKNTTRVGITNRDWTANN